MERVYKVEKGHTLTCEGFCMLYLEPKVKIRKKRSLPLVPRQ